MKLDRLVAATDLSAPARHAATRAALIGRETGANLDLLHIVETGPIERLYRHLQSRPPGVTDRMVHAAREAVRTLAERVAPHYGRLPGVHVVTGAVMQDLAEQLDRLEADLTVVGARGNSYLRHFLLGSVAERMLGRTTHPILVVHQQAHAPYRRLLIPLDFSRSSLPTIETARLIAPSAEAVLFHIAEAPFEGQLIAAGVDARIVSRYQADAMNDAEEKLKSLRQESGLPPDTTDVRVGIGDVPRRIVEMAAELDCDLIAIGKHGAGFVEELLIGSVTSRVLRETTTDVLVTPQQGPVGAV